MRSAEGPLARAPWSLPTRGPLGEPPAARSLRRDESPVLKSCVACTHAACSLQLLARTSGPSETGLFAQRRKQASCPPGPAPTHLSPLSSSWRPIRKKKLCNQYSRLDFELFCRTGLGGFNKVPHCLGLYVYNKNKYFPFLMLKAMPTAGRGLDARGSNWRRLNTTTRGSLEGRVP